MQFSSLLAALVAFTATTTLALPTAVANVEAAEVVSKDPPKGYGYDGPPLDASFCRKAGRDENQCRKDVESCDKKYDNEGRESQCVKNVRNKYGNNYQPPKGYGYDGPPLDASFCRKAGRDENQCRKDVETCDKKYDNEGRESQCVKNVRNKYGNNYNGYDYNRGY